MTAPAATPHAPCLNCGTALVGPHCHACGQAAHLHRSLGAIWHDLAHGAFHFEGRIWRTLPMLVRRPGELTRRYIDGERTRFVSPLALFLFIVFVLFAMLSVLGAHLEAPDFAKTAEGRRARVELQQAIVKNAQATAALSRERAAARDPAAIRRLDARIAEKRRETEVTQTMLATLGAASFTGLENARTGWKRLDKGLAKAARNPNLILYKLQSNAYKFAWMLVPLSLPFMWLLFPFSRRFHAYDHAVFVTYSLCFVSMLVVAASLIGLVGVPAGILFVAVALVMPWHMYRQLRGTYALGRLGASWRMVALFVAANVTTIAFVLLLVGLGLVG